MEKSGRSAPEAGSIVSLLLATSGAGSTHDACFPRFRSVSPDDRGEGAAGSVPEERAGAAKPDLPSGEAHKADPAGNAAEDREPGTRERVEEALRRRAAPAADESDSPGDRERLSAPDPSPEPSAGEHWSSTIRRRVAEGRPAPEAGTADGEDEGAASRAAAASEVRERVERRLLEAEDRRSRSAGPAAASPKLVPPGPGRDVAAGAGREDLPLRPEDTPDWDEPWTGDEEAPAPAGETLPASPPSRIAAFIATCGFIGRVPVAPGTAGAAAGLVAFLLTRNLPGSLPVALFIVALAVGLWAGARHAKDLRQPDPRSVVVDEFCGMWLALVGANPSVLVMVAAFVAFRFLDIVKPPPIRQVERLPGGIGIMADDLVAGGVVRIVLLLALGI